MDDAKTKGITLVVEEISISLGEERFAGSETGLIITTQLMMFLAKARRWSYFFPNLELSKHLFAHPTSPLRLRLLEVLGQVVMTRIFWRELGSSESSIEKRRRHHCS